jgi:Outer membrane efflux protein
MRARSPFQNLWVAAVLVSVCLLLPGTVIAQKKPQTKKQAQTPPISEMEKLRRQYIDTTKEYKASLEKLLALYKASVKKAEERREKSDVLFKDGLISRTELEQAQLALTAEQLKVSGVEQQLKDADTQIAQALLEVETEKQAAKLKTPKTGLLNTSSFIRYAGAGNWVLSQASKIESFFQQTFKRPLPVAVFGQGAIHDRWRLDHRNAMDISLNPDGVEGKVLIDFLQRNGVPFSAFRGAIPGVATGPHIHIGRPSHRY